jgi:hypothetical protein
VSVVAVKGPQHLHQYTLAEARYILSHVYCVHCLPDDDGWIYPWRPGAGPAECSRCPCTERQDLRLYVATEQKAKAWMDNENSSLMRRAVEVQS